MRNFSNFIVFRQNSQIWTKKCDAVYHLQCFSWTRIVPRKKNFVFLKSEFFLVLKKSHKCDFKQNCLCIQKCTSRRRAAARPGSDLKERAFLGKSFRGRVLVQKSMSCPCKKVKHLSGRTLSCSLSIMILDVIGGKQAEKIKRSIFPPINVIPPDLVSKIKILMPHYCVRPLKCLTSGVRQYSGKK